MEEMSLRHLFCVSRRPSSVVLSRQSSLPALRFTGVLCLSARSHCFLHTGVHLGSG